MPDPKFQIHDPVAFVGSEGEEQGFLAKFSGQTAYVVLEDGREFTVSTKYLKSRDGVGFRRVYTRNDAARMGFQVSDVVVFSDRRRTRHEGSIVKMNPKYARVKVSERTWQVPYVALAHAGDSTRADHNRARFAEVAQEGDALLNQHGLRLWRFSFDQALRRGGACSYDRREISVSEQFVLAAPREEVTDAILHEIAHALVGHKHGHDSTWRATAKRIGGSGEVTHDIDFSVAPWILTCRSCGWRTPRMRRGRGLVCKSCGNEVEFQRNDSSESSS